MRNLREDLENKYPNSFLEFNTWLLIESPYGELIDCNITNELWNFLIKEFFSEREYVINSYFNGDNYHSSLFINGDKVYMNSGFNSTKEAESIVIQTAFLLYENGYDGLDRIQ